MLSFDIVVAGAGPAGVMAAICAGRHKKRVGLFEKGNALCRKILLSGKGRCNVTNIASPDEFIARFGRQGEFLRTAFSKFFNRELIDFFKAKGLELKIERQGRVFPATNRAASIVEALEKYLSENKVRLFIDKRLTGIKREGERFRLFFEDKAQLIARKVVLAAGGASFSFTGSSGDGFAIAEKLGHTIIGLKPGLVPLRVKEAWVKEIQGLTLRNIRLTFKGKEKKIVSDIGELQFTYFGVSGALALDLSSEALDLLEKDKQAKLFIDLKPGLTSQQLDERLVREFKQQGNKNIKKIMRAILPLRLIPLFLNMLGLDMSKKGNQIGKKERYTITALLKSFSLEITGSLPLEEAMVTRGGIALKDINPQTMESKIVPGLYFAGEIIDISASSGGYNLQQAFSTGSLAGESAARSLG